jgi:hypothetical protein
MKKCNELITFNIKKIALFPTFLAIDDRKVLYGLLETISDLEIPHVHLRGQDMEDWEIKMFEEKYKTEFYNVHQIDVKHEVLDPIRSKLYVENQYAKFDELVLKNAAGLCVDFSHLEYARIQKNAGFENMKNGILKRYPIGCCHVSAVRFSKVKLINTLFGISRHTLKELKDVDYVKKYKTYLPKYLSLELENSFESQREIKDYLEKILDI